MTKRKRPPKYSIGSLVYIKVWSMGSYIDDVLCLVIDVKPAKGCRWYTLEYCDSSKKNVGRGEYEIKSMQ